MRLVRSISHIAELFVITGCVAVPASAQVVGSPFQSLFLTDALSEAVQRPPQVEPPKEVRLSDVIKRPSALVPLYASLVVLQGLDIHSTSRGLAAGGTEANPVMEPVVKNRAAFVAIKAATTAGVVWASEKLWRKKNRKAAVVLVALTNVGLAAIVANNYRAAR